jgi:hypothetical protein
MPYLENVSGSVILCPYIINLRKIKRNNNVKGAGGIFSKEYIVRGQKSIYKTDKDRAE